MLVTTCFLIFLSMAPEEEALTQSLSVSIVALEADDETVHVELEVSGKKIESVVIHDLKTDIDLYIAATKRAGGFLSQISGFENALAYEELPGDELNGSLSFSLLRSEVPEIMKITLTDASGQSYGMNFKGLLDKPGEPTTFGLDVYFSNESSEESGDLNITDNCGTRICWFKRSVCLWVETSDCERVYKRCCLSRKDLGRGLCLNNYTCEASCPPCTWI